MHTDLQFLCRECKRLLVVMYGQMCEAHLVQRSAQVVHALLALSTQLHVPPQEGETLNTYMCCMLNTLRDVTVKLKEVA